VGTPGGADAGGMAPSVGAYTPAAITSIGYTEHDLQVAALVIRTDQEAACDATGGLIDRMPFTWTGPRSGRIDTDTTEGLSLPSRQATGGTRLHARSVKVASHVRLLRLCLARQRA
jgi:hypothetical protein